MGIHWWWWIAALMVLALELTTGTVYLLMLSLGLLGGGLAAWLGQGFTVQVCVAALLTALGCIGVHRSRSRLPLQASSDRNQDVQIDVGNAVMVESWQQDGTATVQYRGAQWTARLDAGRSNPSAGMHRIVAVQGNGLVLTPEQ